MEVRDSWDRPVPLAAPVLADAETDAPVAYYDGIRAVVAIAAQFTRATWNLPTTCPAWPTTTTSTWTTRRSAGCPG